MIAVRIWAAAAALAGCSLYSDGDFRCTIDEQCGPGGTCSASYCSVADGSCASGLRYGAYSGAMSNACVASDALGPEHGVRGEYYDDMNLTNLKLVRTDHNIDFVWGVTTPDPSMGADSFSVRWTGYLQPRLTEEYRFYTLIDDGVKLWVDGVLLVDQWTDQALMEHASATIALEAGQKYELKMEFFEATMDAAARLYWSSTSQPKRIIPESQLSP